MTGQFASIVNALVICPVNASYLIEYAHAL